jgi:hypothetical protein
MLDATDCGDPGCDTCHPPRQRCPGCGALHADAAVPFCSPGCAVVDDGRETPAASSPPRPAP